MAFPTSRASCAMKNTTFELDCLYLFTFNMFFLLKAEIGFPKVLASLCLNGCLLATQHGINCQGDPIACALLILYIIAAAGTYYIYFGIVMEKFDSDLHSDRMLDQRLSSKVKSSLERIRDNETAQQLSLMYGQMAHDIGTPLSALSMGVELLEFEYRNSVEICEAWKEFEETIDALHASIAIIAILRQAMLDAAKQNSEISAVPSLEPIDITDLLSKQAFAILKQLVSKKTDLAVSWSVDEALQSVKIVSARNWILDMLLNLCSNAVKFTPNGFITISARHSATSSKDMVMFEVADSGKGVPPEKIDSLFTKFSQMQTNGGGTGLGLYSVKAKAELLGGYAGFSSGKNNTGSIFYFAVPFVPEIVSDHFLDLKLSFTFIFFFLFLSKLHTLCMDECKLYCLYSL